MIYQHACVARQADRHGQRTHPYSISAQRAPVNVYKTESSYVMLVFAPGRVKENFQVSMKGNELTVSYEPATGKATPDWIRREYSRGAFERVFTVDESIDATQVSAKYVDGVLEITLPLIPGKETKEQDVLIT